MTLFQNWFAVVFKNLNKHLTVTHVQFQNSMEDDFVFSTKNWRFAIVNSRKAGPQVF